jgi:hypothetical protein
MSTSGSLPPDANWHDPSFVSTWKQERREKLEAAWAARPPKPGRRQNRLEYFDQDHESLTDRARRLEGSNVAKKTAGRRRLSSYQVPALLGKNDAGEFVFSPHVSRARPAKIAKAAEMFDGGLTKKAQRELACGLLGGEVTCRSGHRFSIAYECGNRYCEKCGPRGANKLFSRQRDRLYAVARKLLACGHGLECECASAESKLPHWPPPRGSRPRVVVAKLDFTLMNTGRAGPDLMRHLNLCIKRFCRAIERRFNLSRSDYGLAYCDELGAGNTNAHAHGIYVGPWLPQERRELSKIWAEVTGRSSSTGPIGLIVSIKYAYSFDAALYHAVKYPAKFAEKSTPDRLAELEVIFHRVRRFHTIAAFYNPDVPDPEKPDGRKCPTCGEKLSEPKHWRPLSQLSDQGLSDVLELTRELARARAFAAPDPPG